MKKKLLLRLGLLASLALLGFGFVLSWIGSGISKRGADRIQVGMHFDDVTAILRAPPGDYATGPINQRARLEELLDRDSVQIVLGLKTIEGGFPDDWITPKNWRSNDGSIWVLFDGDDRVVHKQYTPFADTFLDKLCRSLRLS